MVITPLGVILQGTLGDISLLPVLEEGQHPVSHKFIKMGSLET
jgi:hypothetical protein